MGHRDAGLDGNPAAAARLEELLQFERLLADLCVHFTAGATESVDGEMELWMGRLCDALGADRSSFAELRPEGWFVTHHFARAGIVRHPKGPANSDLPWLTTEFSGGRRVIMDRIPDDLPPEAEAERLYFTGVGMLSGIGLPVSVGGAIVCVLSFGVFRVRRTWPPEVIARLQIAGDAFGNALARRKVKERLDRQQAELAHVARVAAMGELASVIAHELDQPLTTVVANADAARAILRAKRPDLTVAADALGDIVEAAMRMAEIIRRERYMLTKTTRGFETVDVNEALREIELFIRAEARRDGARLSFELQPGLPPVQGDRVQLQQVFLNLARNALQAMRERPREARALGIRTASTMAEITLSVADTGPGVEESVLGQMFEPFYTTKPDGLGVGLSISKSIVDAHRGRISAIRNTGSGLTVYVTIPRK